MHCWPQAVVRWTIVISKASPCVSLFCWLSTRSWRKLMGQWSDDPITFFVFFFSFEWWYIVRGLHAQRLSNSPFSISRWMCLFFCCMCRLPEVCWPRDLSWVSSCCHTIWYHYGATWCLHEVVILFFPLICWKMKAHRALIQCGIVSALL